MILSDARSHNVLFSRSSACASVNRLMIFLNIPLTFFRAVESCLFLCRFLYVYWVYSIVRELGNKIFRVLKVKRDERYITHISPESQ